MGTHCSSELNRGHISKSKTAIMKLLLLTVFVASAFATDEVADAAKPVAVAPVHAFHAVHHPFYAGLWGHQQQWPGIRVPGFSSQCFGCRGKGQLRLRLMPNLDITDITVTLLDIMDTPISILLLLNLVMKMISLATALSV